MAKIVPMAIKFVDVVIEIDQHRQLVLCRDCLGEMTVYSTVTAIPSMQLDKASVVHNIMCPNCGGISYIALRNHAISS